MIGNRTCGVLIFLFTMLSPCFEKTAMATEPSMPDTQQSTASKAPKKQGGLDRSGKARKGKASYYGREFYGKKMANGKPMNPGSDVAASKVLPLGTKAEVTNLETGKSAVVDIEDRGPYVPGRIVDLSPQTAGKLDIKKEGVAPVEIKPIVIPGKEDSTRPDSSAPAK